MHSDFSSTQNKSKTELLAVASVSNLPTTGEVEIAGRHYVTADRLAAILGVTVRTLGRWDAARIGPPKIKVGKLVLFDIAKVPDWLASREIGPIRAAGRRRSRS
jgi:DNA-binding transcriptional regulator YiaG